MSEEFSDDFVVEDEEESSRPFLIAAGSLILIFIIIGGVLLAFILNQQRDQSDENEARLATNEAILASNALVRTRQPRIPKRWKNPRRLRRPRPPNWFPLEMWALGQ